MTGEIDKRGHLDTETDTHTARMPWKQQSRGQGDVSTLQGTSKVAKKPLEAR